MDEEQGLSSPIERGIRGIRRSISSNIFGGRRAPQIQGDGVSADIIARNSLALSNVANQLGGISEQVNNINSSLTAIKENLSISDGIERKKEIAKRKREAQLAEQGLREGKESELEKKIQFALLAPVRRVAQVARGILGRLGEALLFLAGGWLTSQALTFLQLNSEGNIEALKKFKDRFIKDLLVIGGILLATTGAFGKIFVLVKGLGALLSRVTFGGFLLNSFKGLGAFILSNVAKFIRFIRRVGVGGLRRLGGLRNLIPLGFIFQNRIAREVKKFFQGAADDLMKYPFIQKMMNRFGQTNIGQNLSKFSKSGGLNKAFNKAFAPLIIALETFMGKAELERAGLEPLQALITSFARAVTQFGLFTAFIKATSMTVGGIFAGVGALLGLLGGPFAPLTSAGLAAKGFAIGKAVGGFLGFLGFLFPEQTKQFTGGLVDLEKFSLEADKIAVESGMAISGVDKETKKKVRGNVFKKNDNVSSSSSVSSDAIEISKIIPEDSEGTGGIVAFKRNEKNLQLESGAVNVLDLTDKNKKRGTAFAGGSDDKGGVDGIPKIDSSNNNDDQSLIARSIMNLNLA